MDTESAFNVFLPTLIKIGEVDDFRPQRVEPPQRVNKCWLYNTDKHFLDRNICIVNIVT